MAEIKLTKPATAHRLILAAVKMAAEGADPLATHVVAASALSSLRNLVSKRGASYATRVFQEVLFEAAKAQIEGRAPPIEAEYAQYFEDVIQEIVSRINDGTINTPSDLSIDVPKHLERMLLAHVVDPYNFLKHADRDPFATMDEDDVNPKTALMYAIAAYSMIFPSEPIPEAVKQFLNSMGLGDPP